MGRLLHSKEFDSKKYAGALECCINSQRGWRRNGFKTLDVYSSPMTRMGKNRAVKLRICILKAYVYIKAMFGQV